MQANVRTQFPPSKPPLIPLPTLIHQGKFIYQLLTIYILSVTPSPERVILLSDLSEGHATHIHTVTYIYTHACTHSCTHMNVPTIHTWTPHIYTHAHTHTCTQYGRTALYFAASYGHEDIIELLLESKADPDLTDKVILIISGIHCYSNGHYIP